MNTAFAAAALALTALSLSACGGKGDDKLGSQVESAADNRADVLEATAETSKTRPTPFATMVKRSPTRSTMPT